MARKKQKKSVEPTPLNRQPGRCQNCAGASFTLHVWQRILHRKCRTCGEVYDMDNMQLVIKGDEKQAWYL